MRERMGRAEDCVPAGVARTVADVWSCVSRGGQLPSNTLIAVNMEYSGMDRMVSEGDEVAFFPPVTGG